MTCDLEFIAHHDSRETFRIVWSGRRLLIGRHPEADIWIQEPTMSAHHAELVAAGGSVMLRDLNSLNGTLLNGVRVAESVLRPGDRIEVGHSKIEVAKAAANRRVKTPSPISSRDDSSFSAQTVKIQLSRLRKNRGEELDEDERIIHLRDLFEALKSADAPDTLLGEVRKVLEQAFPRSRVFILRPTEDGDWQDADNEDEERRPSLTFTNEAAKTSSAVLSSSLPEDERFSAATSVRIAGIETAIAAPASCDDRTVAVLYVDRLGLPPFNRRDLNLLGIAANHVSTVLESVSRFAELRSKNEELQAAREREAELNRNLEKRVEDRTAEIMRQSEEIARLADAKDELLGIAAHDIRGPLTVIQGTTELLQLRLGSLEERTLTRSLNLIHGAARGLGQLLSELLDAKAIEAGTVTLRMQLVSFEELFGASLPVAQLAAEDKSVELKVEADPKLRIEADPQRLGQAITNLLLNAIKFSKAGRRIRLQGRPGSAGEAEIIVEDQGVGIPEEEIEGIFGTFEQGVAGQKLGGTGLGLMIAKRVVDLHGGTVSVKSKVGAGTRFVLSLPTRATEKTAPIPTARPPVAPPAPGAPPAAA
ncbi:MAG: FHA domain-containing protein, partial [bacterium]|nr:FHA domain-containing protein [bacterium]